MTSACLVFATLACVFACAQGQVPPAPPLSPQPKWYPQFSISFNETTRVLAQRSTAGMWWYDSEAKAEVVHRADGNGDRYCGSVHPFAHTPCRHLVTGGSRYLLFPQLGECCMCCTDQQGCGPLSPSWLATATFQGLEPLRGQMAYKWRQDGLQPNYWFATADELQLPLELDQVPNDLTSYDPASFTQRPIDPELLHVPPSCHKRCPLFSVCSLLRHERVGMTLLKPITTGSDDAAA
ncbi:hypothetical protein V8C86DRAFT_2775360 [Haematococcus lacustris]